MRRGFIFSAILHIGLVLVILFGLPSFFHKTYPELNVVTVEVLPVSKLTNVPTAAPKPPKKQEPKKVLSATPPKKALPEPNRDSKPAITPPEPQKKPKPVAAPEPVKAEPVPLPKPEEKPKPQPKKEEPKPEEKDYFASAMKTVEDFEAVPSPNEEKKEDFTQVEDYLDSISEVPFKPGVPLSLSEKDAIRQQIMRNWSVLSGARDAENMVVTLHISLAQDGSVTSVGIVNKTRYASDAVFRAMVDSAVRAVHKSSPLKNLPEDKYDVKDGWSELELNFDPKESVY